MPYIALKLTQSTFLGMSTPLTMHPSPHIVGVTTPLTIYHRCAHTDTFLEKKKRPDRKSNGSRQKNKRGDIKRNQMTVLRFQTVGRHQTSLASLRVSFMEVVRKLGELSISI